MAYLMCGDIPVYSIRTKTVLNASLCPFSSADDFEYWKKNRRFLKSNRQAEEIVAKAGGVQVLTSKRRLSLSDCYWIKHNKDNIDNVTFDKITPYNNGFINAYATANHELSVPDYTLGGSFSKNWACHNGVLGFFKYYNINMVNAEMCAIALAHLLKIPCCNATVTVEQNRSASQNNQISLTIHEVTAYEFTPDMLVHDSNIFIHNMTDVEHMLIPLNWYKGGFAGFDPVAMSVWFENTFTANLAETSGESSLNPHETARNYVLSIILFDAIVANFDREKNKGNWGYIKNSKTGECSPAPMYDFNLAHIDTPNWFLNTIIKNILAHNKPNDGHSFKAHAIRLLEKWQITIENFGITNWIDNHKRLLTGLLQNDNGGRTCVKM